MHSPKQIRAHVDNRSHQQAPGTSAFNQKMVLGGPLFAYEVLSAINEIVERVLLVHQLAIVVPVLAHIVVVANMRDDVRQAAIEQDQLRTRKRRRHAKSIGTVGVQQERSLSVALKSFLIDDRERHLD